MRTICGTHKYLAPELVQTDRGQLQGYDKAIDMWGVGLLAFIMLFGFNPFDQSDIPLTHAAIHERASRDNVSAVLVML